MRGRMGKASKLIAIAMLAVACQTPAQREEKKQMQQEKKMAQAEAKRQKEVAAMEAKQHKEDAKRQAEEDKHIAAAQKKQHEIDQKHAAEVAKADAAEEKEIRESFGAESMRDERLERPIDRFLLAQSAAGARGDAMLNDDHFDGNELNSLGRAKMKLIGHAQPHGSNAPIVVYLNTIDTKAVD